jgi:hypothetical protein
MNKETYIDFWFNFGLQLLAVTDIVLYLKNSQLIWPMNIVKMNRIDIFSFIVDAES